MRILKDKTIRLISLINKYESEYNDASWEMRLVTGTGVLNTVWNAWNNYWRNYLLAHINGGYYIDNTKLHIQYHYSDDVAACLLTYFRTNSVLSHNNSRSILPHREPTWGDVDLIADVLTTMMAHMPSYTHFGYVLSLIGVYKNDLKHFQEIRNAFVHLNNHKAASLHALRTYYIFSAGQKPVDILETIHITSQLKCITHLLDRMRGFLSSL